MGFDVICTQRASYTTSSYQTVLHKGLAFILFYFIFILFLFYFIFIYYYAKKNKNVSGNMPEKNGSIGRDFFFFFFFFF